MSSSSSSSSSSELPLSTTTTTTTHSKYRSAKTRSGGACLTKVEKNPATTAVAATQHNTIPEKNEERVLDCIHQHQQQQQVEGVGGEPDQKK